MTPVPAPPPTDGKETEHLQREITSLKAQLAAAQTELARSKQLHDALLEVLQEKDTQREQTLRATATQLRAIQVQQVLMRHLLFTIVRLTEFITNWPTTNP